MNDKGQTIKQLTDIMCGTIGSEMQSPKKFLYCDNTYGDTDKK